MPSRVRLLLLILLAACRAGPSAAGIPAASAFEVVAAANAAAALQAPESSFGRLIARLSEPGGYFDTDNIITNETSYLHVLDALRSHGVHGGAYIGVGPD